MNKPTLPLHFTASTGWSKRPLCPLGPCALLRILVGKLRRRCQLLEMTRSRLHGALKKLTGGIGRRFKSKPLTNQDPNTLDGHHATSSVPTPSQPTVCNSTPRHPILPKMADQEEDFSSLPLTDRWVHKVRMAREDVALRVKRSRVRCANCMCHRNRSGKCANKPTKKQPNSSSSPPMNMTPLSGLSSRILRYGRARWQTATSLLSKMA